MATITVGDFTEAAIKLNSAMADLILARDALDPTDKNPRESIDVSDTEAVQKLDDALHRVFRAYIHLTDLATALRNNQS